MLLKYFICYVEPQGVIHYRKFILGQISAKRNFRYGKKYIDSNSLFKIIIL